MNANLAFELLGLRTKKGKKSEAMIKPTEPAVKIRELQKSDRKKVLDLMNEFPEIFPPQYVNGGGFGGMVSFLNFARSANRHLAGSFIIELDGKIAGHIAYCRDIRQSKNTAYELKAMVISRPFQKKGYGTVLIHYVLDRLKWIKADFAHLTTQKPALLFFSRFNFEIVGMHEYLHDQEKKKYVLEKKL